MLPKEIGVGREHFSSGCLVSVPFGSYRTLLGTNPHRTNLIVTSNAANNWFVRLGLSDDVAPYFAMRAGGGPLYLRLEDVGNALNREVQVWVDAADASFGVCETSYYGETES